MYKTYIVFILGSLVTIFGVYLAHRFTARRGKRKEFNNAAETFCNTLENAIKYIEKAEHPVCEIIRVLFDEQNVAAKNFERHLWWLNRRSFNRAWNKYKRYCNQHTHPSDIVTPYLASADSEFEIKNRKELEEHLRALLKFTRKHTKT